MSKYGSLQIGTLVGVERAVGLEHRRFLALEFTVECPESRLEPEVVEIIEKYGAWMNALANGVIAPITEAQNRFVELNNGSVEPVGKYENAWFLYRRECLFQDALKIEALLSQNSLYNYESVVFGFQLVARLGHPCALSWLQEEGITSASAQVKISPLIKLVVPLTPAAPHGSGRNSVTGFGPGASSAGDWSNDWDNFTPATFEGMDPGPNY